jgi:hypothetical protein
METVKLDKLFIEEVSGVDHPANQLEGWMVVKSADQPDPLLLVADEMETVTKASSSKEPYGDVTYADPGFQKDGKKRYPLDTEAHVRAAWSYINQEDNASLYSAEQVASVKAKIKAAMKKLGADMGDDMKKSSETIVAKLKGIILGAPTGKEDDMEKAEFVEALGEHTDVLAKAVADAVAKAVAPAPGEGAAEVATPAADAVTAESVVKAINEAIEVALTEKVEKQYNDLIEKVLDRIEGIEKHIGIAARKSLDGQETADAAGEPVTKSTPDLGDAIAAAFKR